MSASAWPTPTVLAVAHTVRGSTARWRARTLIAGLTIALLACASTDGRLPATDLDTRIPSRGLAIPATWVVPARVSDVAVPLVVLIHGHGGTRHEAGGFRRLAESLARHGIASIRVDYPGCGDSDEPWTENNLTNMLTDTEAAVAWAETATMIDAERIGLVGFSMGARVAALLADGDREVDAMVLWAPAVEDGVGVMAAMLGGEATYAAMRQTASADGWVPFTTFWGQRQQLGAQWFVDLERSMPMQALARFRGALQLIHGSADVVVPPEVSIRAEQAAIEARRVQRLDLLGADHGFGLFAEQDRYSERLIETTVAFFDDEW